MRVSLYNELLDCSDSLPGLDLPLSTPFFQAELPDGAMEYDEYHGIAIACIHFYVAVCRSPFVNDWLAARG